MSETDTAYIARCKCDSIVAALVDFPGYEDDHSRDIGRWIRRGLTVERTTVGEARAMPKFLRECTCSGTQEKTA